MIIVTTWILGMLIVLFFTLKKAGIDPKNFGVHCILYGPFIFAGGLIFSFVYGAHKSNVIERNYVGAAGVREEENINSDGTNTSYYNTYVFPKNDNALKNEIYKLDKEFIDGSSKEEFIFWQTALAKGFEPKNIRGYNCCESFSQKLELYLTVGPLTIIECLIKAATSAFLLLIIPLIGFLFKKRLFFDDWVGLKKIYK